MALTQIPIELSSTPGIVDNSNDTAITIDSSENVLVGTTDSAPGVGNTNTGGAFGSNGYGVFSRTGTAGQATAYFNKNTNVGEIIKFNKDGSTVGSIGVESADNFIIEATATDHAGLLLWGSGGSGRVTPRLNGSDNDGNVDLGRAGNRFKDLYLSGAINGGQLSHVVVNTLHDDSVYVLDPPNSIGIVMLAGRNDNYDYIHGIVSYRTSAQTYATQMGAGNANVLIGEFSGVPGVSDVTNGVFSVVVSDNGNIYFWNRLGSAVSVSITLLGA